jgi:glycolate oxidase FAD binding subunit
VRLEGGEGSVRGALDIIDGEDHDLRFWDALRDHRLAFFDDPRPLWRISVPNATALATLPGAMLLDWAGAQWWVKSDAPEAAIRQAASAAGGHATLFTSRAGIEPFHPLPDPLMRFHRQLKARLDPHGIFNPGRMYADF